MSSRVIIEKLTCHTDARGLVVEPLTVEQIAAQHNAHLVLSEPGCIRGNHCHARGNEITVVIGPCLARLREDGIVRDVEVPDGEAFRFSIPAGVAHAFRNTGSKTSILMGFNTEIHNPAQPDLIKDVLI